MKALVAIKRVPDGNAPLRLLADGANVDLAGMPMRINPFDEAALEMAVQWKEAGTISEIVAVTIGDDASQDALRQALAFGADRAIRIASDHAPESLAVARLLHAITLRENPDLVLLGKQASDADNAQTAPMLAALLDWPQGVFASALAWENNLLQVTREIEGGQETLALTLPAVISADLRLANPRYLKLPQLLAAKKKPIETLPAAELCAELNPKLSLLGVAHPPARRPARKVVDVAELLACLQAEGLLGDAPQIAETATGLHVQGRALVLAEASNGKLHPAVRRTVSAARQLSDDITLLIAGTPETALDAASIAGVTRVLRLELDHPQAEDLAPLLAAIMRDRHITALLAAATPFAKAILPRAAALLDSPMLSDVLAIQSPAVFVRPIHAGELLATMHNPQPIKILTIRPAAFPVAGTQTTAPIESIAAPAAARRPDWLGATQPDLSRPALADARIVIAGGRGLGSAEQFHALLAPLADKLNAAIGATRAAVDAEFIGNDHQVGQTGTIVAPEFYFAIGLSGAAQHLAGMRDARVIVAINQDPAAPICKHADYVLEGDLAQAVPALLNALP